MKLLSVTVPCYNSQEYMKNCVDSLLTGGEDVEILIVDDGSRDDTLKIAREYEAAGAACISVLTEPKWFLGSDRYLEEIA